MKKLLFSILMVSAILLAACSSASAGTSPGSTSAGLPIETQLAVGTLKLDGTEQDVTVEQAQDLLVLWQVYKEISQSDTAAQAEVDGLISQIQETMTEDQMQAITTMNITQQDVTASMQGMTVVSNNSSDSAVNIPSGSGSGGGMPAGGPGMDGGAPPDGGMPADIGGAAPASGTDQSPSTPADLQSSAGIPVAVVEAVIQALQQKIAA